MLNATSPIGVFDSGYGGLTVLRELVNKLPEYDYIYLGDNARAPYGNRSFETVYNYTLQAVQRLFNLGCPLVILACNTSSAKALRSIQQTDLPRIAPERRVLGVLRPVTEIAGQFTRSNHIGVLGTAGTVASESYPIEIKKFFPGVEVFQQACPMWVPLVENNEHLSEGADFFVQKYIHQLYQQSGSIDTIILGCTHYPLLYSKIQQALPDGVNILSQGDIVAKSLAGYLRRHTELECRCSRNGTIQFYTTDDAAQFGRLATVFYGAEVKAEKIILP